MTATTAHRLVLPLAAALLLAGCPREIPVYDGNDFSADPPHPGPFSGRIVTTNNGDDTLTLVDPAKPSEAVQVPVGINPVELEGPHHVVASRDGAFLFFNLSEAVAGSGSGPHGAHGAGTVPGFVVKMRASDGATVGLARVDPNPGDIALTPDGKTVIVTHYNAADWAKAAAAGDIRKGDSNLVLVNTDTMEVTAKIPICPAAHGVRTSADGSEVYATCGPDEIAVVRLDQPDHPARRVLLPGGVESASCNQCPYALSVAPDGSVWVSALGQGGGARGGGTLHVYDPKLQDFDPKRAIDFCGSPVFAAFSRTGEGPNDYLAYVPEQRGCGDWLRAYTPNGAGAAPTSVGEVLFTGTQCLNAHMIELSEDGHAGYLVCEGDHAQPGTLVTVDLQDPTKPLTHATAPTGVFPDGLALVPAAKIP